MKAAIFGMMMALVGLTRGSAEGNLMLYGGEKLDVFLGCMDCSDRDENSIWHKSGPYGYAHFNDTSIWNGMSKFGGDLGDYSPFNGWAKYPPALFDSHGKFLGYMTVDEKHPRRTRLKIARIVLAYWKTIKEDVPGFYDIYFAPDENVEPENCRPKFHSWR